MTKKVRGGGGGGDNMSDVCVCVHVLQVAGEMHIMTRDYSPQSKRDAQELMTNNFNFRH